MEFMTNQKNIFEKDNLKTLWHIGFISYILLFSKFK